MQGYGLLPAHLATLSVIVCESNASSGGVDCAASTTELPSGRSASNGPLQAQGRSESMIAPMANEGFKPPSKAIVQELEGLLAMQYVWHDRLIPHILTWQQSAVKLVNLATPAPE